MKWSNNKINLSLSCLQQRMYYNFRRYVLGITLRITRTNSEFLRRCAHLLYTPSAHLVSFSVLMGIASLALSAISWEFKSESDSSISSSLMLHTLQRYICKLFSPFITIWKLTIFLTRKAIISLLFSDVHFFSWNSRELFIVHLHFWTALLLLNWSLYI